MTLRFDRRNPDAPDGGKSVQHRHLDIGRRGPLYAVPVVRSPSPFEHSITVWPTAPASRIKFPAARLSSASISFNQLLLGLAVANPPQRWTLASAVVSSTPYLWRSIHGASAQAVPPRVAEVLAVSTKDRYVAQGGCLTHVLQHLKSSIIGHHQIQQTARTSVEASTSSASRPPGESNGMNPASPASLAAICKLNGSSSTTRTFALGVEDRWTCLK